MTLLTLASAWLLCWFTVDQQEQPFKRLVDVLVPAFCVLMRHTKPARPWTYSLGLAERKQAFASLLQTGWNGMLVHRSGQCETLLV